MQTKETAEFVKETSHDAVLEQLQIIVKSQHFRNSRRCPALLDYSVRHTLSGDKEKLRERNLGTELFGRKPSYDTNTDPIVRVAAGEVRKRLAQYYLDEGRSVAIRIELPPGSYVAEFHTNDVSRHGAEREADDEPRHPSLSIRLPDRDGMAPLQETRPALLEADDAPREATVSFWRSHRVSLSIATSIALIGIVSAALHVALPRNDVTIFWSDFLQGADGVPVIVGQSRDLDPTLPSPNDPLITEIHRSSRSVSFGDGAAAVALCNRVASLGHNCRLLPGRSIDLHAMRKQTSIFVGAFNNPWVLRLTNSIRFRFQDGPVRQIIDQQTNKVVGSVDFHTPLQTITTDYAVIARFHSDLTDSNVVVVAGIGPMSTESATEFITEPARMSEWRAADPTHWRGHNLEAVIATDIVNGKPGHSRIIATASW